MGCKSTEGKRIGERRMKNYDPGNVRSAFLYGLLKKCLFIWAKNKESHQLANATNFFKSA
jgi:hypothetical protein